MSRTRGPRALHADPVVAPDECESENSTLFKSVRLRLLMKEREDVARALMNLDFSIWVLEEQLRSRCG
jgi:hypothetical protein